MNGELSDRSPLLTAALLTIALVGAAAIAATVVAGAVPATGCYPRPSDVLMGGTAVVAGCLAASYALYLARHTSNWIYLAAAAGAVLFVVGIVGQRAYGPTQNTLMAVACPAQGTDPGMWGAALELPVLGAAINRVAMAGVLLGVVGFCGVLLFERVGGPPPLPSIDRGDFEDSDAV